MKLLSIQIVFSSLILLTSSINAAPCKGDNCGAISKGAAGIRQYAAIGTKNWARRVLDRPAKGWFNAEWNKAMREIVNDAQSCAFENHYPALAAKFHWSDAYVNENIKPTRSQARDPSWSNYIWNKKDSGATYVFDGISDALNSELIDNGSGIAKLALIIGMTAPSGNLIPPRWMTKDKSLTWLEGKNSNGKSDNWHVRFDNPKAVEHAADFLTAFLAKYGDNKGLHSINLGEYYLGQKEFRPSGLNRDKYWIGVKNLWNEIVHSAPRDENGQRIDIVQTNPLFSADVSIDDMEALGIGISESDTNISFPVDNVAVTANMRKLYDRNSVHVMINGDGRYACQSRRQRWDGTPNPFGHKKGYSGVATPQEIFWYHGDQGPAPAHSIFMTIAYWCDGPQSRQNFFDAVKKFGRCGTETSRWGQAPAAFSGGSAPDLDKPGSKPKPPTVVVN